MTSRHQSVPPEVRPGTGRVRVTELKHPDGINPTPVMKPREDVEAAADLHLSPEKLESLCGTHDLSHVTFLEVCVDTRSNTLGNFGAFMPKLVQLKLNNSTIMSVRDLGTTVSRLQVLWMSRCCLQDLDGISSFTSLQELYVAYNYLSELSQVGMLDDLKLLDLEGNDVDDLVQVQYLGLCSKLQRLSLEGNPVCSRPNPTTTQTTDYSYRAALRELIPQLRYLDDVRAEEDGPSCWSTVGEDWDIFRDSIRGGGASQPPAEDEEPADGPRPPSRHSSPGLPSFWTLSPPGSRPPAGVRPSSAAGPGVPSPPGSGSGSVDSSLATVEAETSTLTHDSPSQTAPARSTFARRHLPGVRPSGDLRDAELKDRADVFAELRAWREQHSRRLHAIEKERSPQVLTVRHDDRGEEESESDEEGVSGVKSDSGDEEHGGDDECRGAGDPASPDSSFRSLSPDPRHGEEASPDVARLCLSPGSTPSPSPPAGGTASSASRSVMGFRARRLRPGRADPERLLHLRSMWNPETKTSPAAAQISRTNV